MNTSSRNQSNLYTRPTPRAYGAVKDGGTLLSVHCDTSEEIDTAKDALKETGARYIASTGEEGSKGDCGGRGTFGSISDGERLSTPRSIRGPGRSRKGDRSGHVSEVLRPTIGRVGRTREQ
jgi:hypothetical protein